MQGAHGAPGRPPASPAVVPSGTTAPSWRERFIVTPGSPYYHDIQSNLRKVHPYNHTYLTYAKQRWIGRELLEIFTTEFRDRSQDFYDWAISNGTVMVNGKVVDGNYVIRDGDLISNVIHRHEPPILGGRINIYHKDDETGIWVVEKKGSMPIHATGRYRENTLLQVLKNEEGLENVSTANRLDRLVSGIMLIGTNRKAAQELGKAFQTPGAVKKEYVARVTGRFPCNEKQAAAARENASAELPDHTISGTPSDAAADEVAEDVLCEEPILTIDKQIGVNVVHPDGRPCTTIFRRISYDARTDTSVVRCRPVTGRSHQLRVHLQFLGHPIANDPIYNNQVAWGKQKGRGGLFREVIARPSASATTEASSLPETEDGEATSEGSRSKADAFNEEGTRQADTTVSPPAGSFLQDNITTESLATQLSEVLCTDKQLQRRQKKERRKKESSGFSRQHPQMARGSGRAGMSMSHDLLRSQRPSPSIASSSGQTTPQTPLPQHDGASPHPINDVLGTGTETSLNEEAIAAILELRKVRDSEDNFARFRDMDRKPPLPLPVKGIGEETLRMEKKRGPPTPRAQQNTAAEAESSSATTNDEENDSHLPNTGLSAKRGIRMLSRAEREALASSYQQHEKMMQQQASHREHDGQTPNSTDADDDPESYIAVDEKGEYCKICGIPLLPDPKPEHLLIWLHAIRYHTAEWDYSSPLPEWARTDWQGSLEDAQAA